MMKLALISAMLVGTCAFAPTDADDWTPPDHYREVWKTAEMCTGKHKKFSNVHWHVVPGQDFKCDSGRCIGYWSRPSDIYIAQAWIGVDWVPKHEIIHYLTGFGHDNGPRDIQIWGVQCRAMWGWLESDDPKYVP